MSGSIIDQDDDDQIVFISTNKEYWLEAYVGSAGLWIYEMDTMQYENRNYTLYIYCYDGEDVSTVISIEVWIENDEDDDPSIESYFLMAFVSLLIIMAIILIIKRRYPNSDHQEDKTEESKAIQQDDTDPTADGSSDPPTPPSLPIQGSVAVDSVSESENIDERLEKDRDEAGQTEDTGEEELIEDSEEELIEEGT